MRQELELQLHRQYAENNNANLGSIVSLIVALLAVFAGYGHVFLNTSNNFSAFFKSFSINGTFTLDALIFTAAAVYVVLAIIYYICLNQGYKQRMEQFITFAIRFKYYKLNNPLTNADDIEDLLNDEYHQIFPSGYTPFKKINEKGSKSSEANDKKDTQANDSKACEVNENKDKKAKECKCCKVKYDELVQGLFGDLLPVLKYISILIAISLIIKLLPNIYFNRCHDFSTTGIVAILLLIILLLIICYIICKRREELRNKYKKRVKDYINHWK